MFSIIDKTILFIILCPVLFVCVILDIYTTFIAYPILWVVFHIKDRITGQTRQFDKVALFAITKAVLSI